MKKYRINLIDIYTFEHELILNAADREDLEEKVTNILEGKRRRMGAEDAQVVAQEIEEKISP